MKTSLTMLAFALTRITGHLVFWYSTSPVNPFLGNLVEAKASAKANQR